MVSSVITDLLVQPGGLASELTDLRVRAGLNVQQLADAMAIGRSKASRIGNGRQVPTAEEVRRWASACDAIDQIDRLHGLLSQFTAQHVAWRRLPKWRRGNAQPDYNRLAETTTHTVLVETALIPGLLQTRDYARAALRYLLGLNQVDPEVETAVDDRIARQRYLADSGKRFDLLMTEYVLRFAPVPAQQMIVQLDRLLAVMADYPNVRIGIIPGVAGLPVVPWNSFGIYDEIEIHVETFDGLTFPDEPRDTDLYRQVVVDLWGAAAEGADAEAMVRGEIERHRQASNGH